MELYLIRHGNMAGDPHQYMEAPVSGSLSAQGEVQAEALCRKLSGIEFTHFYASPLGRAIQTAQPLAEVQALEIQVLPWLEEWKPAHLLEERAETEYEKILARAAELRPEQTWKTSAGESMMQMADRMIPGLLALLSTHGVEAGHGGFLMEEDREERLGIFSHGGTLNLLLMYLMGVPLKPGNPFRFHETGYAVISFQRVVDVYYPVLHLNP